MRKINYLTCFALALILIMSGCAQRGERRPLTENQQEQEAPTHSTLLAAAQADPNENGCVSCHKKTAEVDRSLPAYVKRIAGHPEVKETTVSACYGCHEAQKNYKLYKSFVRGTHISHWKSETFYTKMKGQCSSCHTVETNGVSGIKDYPLAGYRTFTAAQEGPQQQAQPQVKSVKEKAPAKAEPKPQEQPKEVLPQQQPMPENKTNGGAPLPTPTP